VAGAAELAAVQAAAVARGLGAAAQKANAFLLREPLPVPPHTQGAHAHRTNSDVIRSQEENAQDEDRKKLKEDKAGFLFTV
jgi:hypothetical protein